jgi:hypothetical protein
LPKPGRKPAVVPPPPQKAGSAHGGITLTVRDLLTIAENVGLRVVCNDCEHQLRIVDDALHSWVLWNRVDRVSSTPSMLCSWNAALQCWIADGIRLLGGSDGPGSPAWPNPDNTPLLAYAAVAHFMRGWPRPYTGDPPTLDPAQFTRWQHLESMLRGAGALHAPLRDPRATGENEPDRPAERAAAVQFGDEYGATRDLVFQTLSALGALRILGAGVADYAAGLPIRPRSDETRELLMRMLAHAYEALHGERYTISNRATGATRGRDTIPAGPALAWTRALFKLAAERASEMGAAIDAHSDFEELLVWMSRPDAAAELIRPVDAWKKLDAERAEARRRTTGGAQRRNAPARSSLRRR